MTSATHVLHTDTVAALRKEEASGSVASTLALAIVESISGRSGYDAYAKTNSGLLAPHMSTLTVVSRTYVDQTKRFKVLVADEASEQVDRVPFVFSRGPAVLSWLLDDEYLSGNLHRRHATSGHAQVYIASSARDDMYGGESLGVLAQHMRDGPVPFVVTEIFAGAEGGAALPFDDAWAAHGGQLVLSRRIARADAPSCAPHFRVLEGRATEHLTIHRFPSWADVENCAGSAVLRDACEQFEGRARALAFATAEP
jgi:hypothetical protein